MSLHITFLPLFNTETQKEKLHTSPGNTKKFCQQGLLTSENLCNFPAKLI